MSDNSPALSQPADNSPELSEARVFNRHWVEIHNPAFMAECRAMIGRPDLWGTVGLMIGNEWMPVVEIGDDFVIVERKTEPD